MIIKRYIWQILLAVAIFIIFLQRSCKKDNDTPANSVIITPEKKGDFKFEVPKEEPRKEKFPVFVKGKTIYLDNPIDSSLALTYRNERDSIQRELMYYKAIQKRDYIHKFEDKNIIGIVKAKTTGTLDSLGLSYIIKPDTIKAPVSKFSIYTGGGVYNTGVKINLGIQNKKGDIFRVSYDPLNERYFVDYDFRIFNYKK